MTGCKAHHKILRGSVAYLSYATALSGTYGKEKSETCSGDDDWSWMLAEAYAKEGDPCTFMQE